MSKVIKNPLPIIKDYKVRGKETPLTNEIREYVLNHPNCTIRDICDSKGLENGDSAHIRRVVRRMIEGHKLIQRFTVP